MFFEFVNEYYLDPIRQDSGYNPVNTLTWAIIFVIAIWLLYEHFFRKYKVKIDRDFTRSLLGWIIFGALLRIVRDLGLTTSPFLVTPSIYVVVFAVSFATLLVALRLKNVKKVKLASTWGLCGYVLSAVAVAAIFSAAESLNVTAFLFIYLIWLAWFFVVLLAKRYFAGKFFTFWNISAIMAHLLDAAGTFVSMTYYGFTEKHVLGRVMIEFLETNDIFLINGSGSWIMFALKLAVIPLALWAIDKYSENELEKKYLKMIIIILGLGIGIRNSFLLLTCS